MRNSIVIFISLFLAFNVSAKFEMTILDSDIKVENKKLKKIEKKIKRKPSSKKFLRQEERDYYLDKYFYEFVEGKDNMDRDIFYKKLMTYPLEDLQVQYEWLDRDTYNNFLADIPPL